VSPTDAAPAAPNIDPSTQSVQSVTNDPGTPVEAAEPDASSETIAPDQSIEAVSVIHATRTWVQYGIFGFAVLCIIIGAMEALFGR
jgi:hypothetical protein